MCGCNGLYSLSLSLSCDSRLLCDTLNYRQFRLAALTGWALYLIVWPDYGMIMRFVKEIYFKPTPQKMNGGRMAKRWLRLV